MPNFGPIIEAAAKVAGRVLKPSLAEAGERTAAQILKEGAELGPSVVQRHVGVPFAGDPAMKAGLRSMAAPQTTDSFVEQVGRAVRSFVESDPGMPKDVQRKLVDHRHSIEQARTSASQIMRPTYEHLQGDRPTQAALLWDHAVAADDLAQARRDKYDAILKLNDDGKVVRIPLDQWEAGTAKLDAAVKADPQVHAAAVARSNMWKEVFDDMVNEGAVIRERELGDYTPMRHITGIARGLAHASGDESIVRRLSQLQRRGMAGGARETNLASLEHDVLTNYFQWKQNRKLFNDLMADPALNLTSKFKWGDPLPRNLVRYDPKAGQVGYMPPTPEEGVFSGIADGLKLDKYNSGGFVIPRTLKRALDEIAPHDALAEDVWRRAGRAASRWLTVYNPKNTALNIVSDLPTALMGLPGEKAQPLGVLKWYGVTVAKKIAKSLTGDETPLTLKVNGQLVDVDQLVESHGLERATFAHQVAGSEQGLPPEMANLFPQGEVQAKDNPLAAGMKNFRQNVELGPRIAAGLDALERTGDPAEFGRVARRSTLEYGAGAPLISREPMAKAVAPFLEFAGLQARRVMELAGTPGSRTRTWAALAAIPMAYAMWNRQSPAFQKVEDSLPKYEQTSAHIIMRNPNTGEPAVDRTGKPVVLRARWFITEDYMKQAGLGNLPARVMDVATGHDTPMQFLDTSVKTAMGNMGSLLTMPSLALDMLSETDRFGKHRNIGEKLARTIPALRIAQEGVEGFQHGPAEGAKRLGEELSGTSFANVMHRGEATMDAGLIERKKALKDAKMKLKIAAQDFQKEKRLTGKKESPEMKSALAEVRKAAAELERFSTEMSNAGRLKKAGSSETVPPTAPAPADTTEITKEDDPFLSEEAQ